MILSTVVGDSKCLTSRPTAKGMLPRGGHFTYSVATYSNVTNKQKCNILCESKLIISPEYGSIFQDSCRF